jgi:hypothetical protein
MLNAETVFRHTVATHAMVDTADYLGGAAAVEKIIQRQRKLAALSESVDREIAEHRLGVMLNDYRTLYSEDAPSATP